MIWGRVLMVALTPLLFAPHAVRAIDYPEKPVRIVVPTGAGGAVDVVARLLGNFLQPRLGQSVVIENKPGAQTLLGAKYVAHTPPDGHTLLFSASISAFPVFSRDPGVNVSRDFEFISTVIRTPVIIAVNASRPFKTFADMAAYSKANPGKLNFASYGRTVWLMTEMLNQATGIKATHIPFSVPPQAAQAVASGDADYFISTISNLQPVVESGRVRMLGVTTNARSPNLPDIPSLGELGIKSDDLVTWMGLFAPTKTPRSIIDRLNSEIHEFLRQPEIIGRLKTMGFEPYATTPEEFRDFFQREEKSSIEAARAMGIKPE
jgi:tripartite-type tricarboxylate transporter receptor subunit TctC